MLVDLRCAHNYPPTVKHDLDVGFDIFTHEDFVLPSFSQDARKWGNSLYYEMSYETYLKRVLNEDYVAFEMIRSMMFIYESQVFINHIHYGYWIKLYDKSGMFAKRNILVGAGVIDTGYISGEIGVALLNLNPFPVLIPAGTAIAQGVVHRAHYPSETISVNGNEIEVLETANRNKDGGLWR